MQAPFIVGGAEILVQELRDNLERRGFRTDVASVPFKWYPVSEIVRQALAWRLLDLTESNGTRVDLVIPTKFPSYPVRHPRKVAWLFHQHREVYDLYGTPYCSFRDTPEDNQVRDAIHTMDRTGLSECRSIYTTSRNVADRLSRYNGLPGSTLYPPPHHLGRYLNAGFGDYLKLDNGVTIAGGQDDYADKIFRVSHLGYYDDLDMITVTAALERTLAALKHPFPRGAGVAAAHNALLGGA